MDFALVTLHSDVSIHKLVHITYLTWRTCKTGKTWLQWQAVTILILFACTECTPPLPTHTTLFLKNRPIPVVLLLRIYAIYGRNRRILAVILSMFILCLGAEIAVVFLDLKGALGEI